VGLAVEEGDPDVDQRVAGEHALGELGAGALLHRGDEVAWHGAADDLVDELETATAGERLDLEVAHGILPVPAGLLDVPALDDDLLDEGLAQRGRNGSASTCTP
jgi:hypothetical protein